MRDKYAAAKDVEALTGEEVNFLAFDSAADIYAHGLKQADVDVTTKDVSALRDLCSLAVKAKSANGYTPRPDMVFDSADKGKSEENKKYFANL